PRAVVAREDDLPLDVDPAPLQLFVVLRHPMVDVDELARDVAVDGIGVVDGKLLVGLAGRGVLLEGRLRQRRFELRGRDQLEEARLRRGKEDPEFLYARLVAP